MKIYTKKKIIEEKNYFIMIPDNEMFLLLKKEFPIFGVLNRFSKKPDTMTCFSFRDKWMSDNGNYFKKQGDIEIFLHELPFFKIKLNYEIY